MSKDLIHDIQFMKRQYGHLPAEEIPTGGAILDVTAAIDQHAPRVKMLDRGMREKRVKTAAWVESTYPGMTAVQLTRPYVWADADPRVQEQASQWLMGTILSVYGDGYPLANKDHDVNMRGFNNRSLLTYFGVMAPQEFSNGHINADPSLALRPDINAIATSSLVRSPHGIAELGRTARLTEFPEFDGGILAMESGYDWLRNRHRFLEQIHKLIATIRGGAEHFHTPSSGPIQNLLLGKVPFRIDEYAPLYNVNHMEPVLEASLPRTIEERQLANKNVVVHTPQGPHVDYLKVLIPHQMGNITPGIEIVSNGATPLMQGNTEYHGENIYGLIDVKPNQQDDGQVGLEQATADLEARSPIVRVKVPVTPEGAATQAWFLARGYTITGFHPAENAQYLDMSGDEPTIESFRADPVITMAKLGAMARTGRVGVVEAYLPTPADSRGVDLHGAKLREELYKVDHRIRQTIGV